jgi:hypothetical protein
MTIAAPSLSRSFAGWSRSNPYWLAASLGAALLFAGYLFVYEDTWMNRVVALALLAPVAAAAFLFSRRPKASFVAAILLLLVLAAFSRAKYDITTVSISVFDFALLDPGAVWFALRQEEFFWQKTLALCFALVVAALFYADRPAGLGLIKRIAVLTGALTMFFGLAFAQEKGERALLAMNGEIGQLSYLAKSFTHLPWFFRESGFLAHAPLDDPSLPAPGTRFGAETCEADGKPPHLIVISDESSMDTTVQPGVEPDPVLAPFFASYDGKKRVLLSESYGGATWLAPSALSRRSCRASSRRAMCATICQHGSRVAATRACRSTRPTGASAAPP